MEERELKKKINQLVKEKTEMLVVIDTLQQILGRAESVLNEGEKLKYEYVFSSSAKWALNWKES